MKRIEIAIAFVFSTVILISCKNDNKVESIISEPEMNGVEQAIQQEIFMTRDPHTNTVPVERLHVANAYMKMVQQARLTGVAALTWEERGPNNVGGRTRSIMIDKRDATGNTVFAGSVSGGLFKTTNFTSASVVWAPVNDFLPNLAITCMLQDRSNGSIMYAGTGEGWFNIDAARGNGIYKSTDGGTTWNVLASTIKTTPADSTFEYVQDLGQDSSGNLYASLRNLIGASRGVKRSGNGGTSWVQVLGAPLPGFNTGRAGDLEVASNGDVYATLGLTGEAITNKSVVMKSSFATHGANAGNENTWIEITPVRGLPTRRSELAVAKSDPQRLYLLMQDSATDQVIGTYRSFNGGASWDSVASAPALNNGVNSQTWYNLIAAVDPNNADILVVGGLHLGKSTDAGVTWATISTSPSVHVDQHALIFDGSSKLIAGNDGGIAYSTDINTASPTFTNKNNGFNCTQYYGVDLHPTTTNYFLAGAQDNGTQKFTSAGINTTTNASGGDGGWPHIDQNNGGNLQITSNTANRYNISVNGGASFSFASTVFNDRGQFINPTDLDDQNDILYCGDDPGKYFFITNLAGVPFGTQVTVGAFGSREVTFVKVDPVTPTTVWMGLSPNVGTIRPMVVKLTSANSATPVLVSQGLVGTVNGAAISSVDIDPTNTNHVIATLSNYGVTSVWESTDGGATFNSIEGNLPDMPIWWGMFAPAGAQFNGATGGNGGIILGTELGAWTTSVINGTSTQWATSGSGLPNARVYMLKYRSADNVLVAATHGRGLFTTTLTVVPVTPPPTGVPNIPNTKDFIKYISVENNQLQVVVGKLQTQTMTMQLFDMNGRLMMQRRQRYENTVLDVSRYQSGSYILKVMGDKNERFVRQVVK